MTRRDAASFGFRINSVKLLGTDGFPELVIWEDPWNSGVYRVTKVDREGHRHQQADFTAAALAARIFDKEIDHGSSPTQPTQASEG